MLSTVSWSTSSSVWHLRRSTWYRCIISSWSSLRTRLGQAQVESKKCGYIINQSSKEAINETNSHSINQVDQKNCHCDSLANIDSDPGLMSGNRRHWMVFTTHPPMDGTTRKPPAGEETITGSEICEIISWNRRMGSNHQINWKHWQMQVTTQNQQHLTTNMTWRCTNKSNRIHKLEYCYSALVVRWMLPGHTWLTINNGMKVTTQIQHKHDNHTATPLQIRLTN